MFQIYLCKFLSYPFKIHHFNLKLIFMWSFGTEQKKKLILAAKQGSYNIVVRLYFGYFIYLHEISALSI